jgi:hypothetical protein
MGLYQSLKMNFSLSSKTLAFESLIKRGERKMRNKFVKLLMAGIFLAMSFGATAQDMETRVERKIGRLKNVIQRIEQNIYSMNREVLQNTERNLKTAIATLRNRGGGDGGGTGRRTTVSGSIESTSFVFDVRDAMDLAYQCVSQFKGKLGNSDDATVSVNFSAERKLHTSGWWRSAGEVCGEIAAASVTMGLKPKTGYSFTAIGTIEAKSFAFQGNSLRDVLLQCTDFYNAEVAGNVDDLTVFNGTEFVKNHTSGWWTNANQVCTIIIQQIK